MNDLEKKDNDKTVNEVSRTSLNGAIINRKLSPAVFKNELMKKLDLKCNIVTSSDIEARYGKNGFKAQYFPDGDIALLQYKFIGKDISKEVMQFFNDTCSSDLGKKFEVPGQDYLVLGEVPFSTRGQRPEPYTGIAIPLQGVINVSDDVASAASKTRALGDYGENKNKKLEQIFVTSFNKMRGSTEKSYNLMCYQKSNTKTRDKIALFFACDQVPAGDTLVRTDIVKIINRILSENTQIKEIYHDSAITEDDISRYGDVETKNGPKTIFYIFMNPSGQAVDVDEGDNTEQITQVQERENSEETYKGLVDYFNGMFDADGQVYMEYKPETKSVICHMQLSKNATPQEMDAEKTEIWEMIRDYIEDINERRGTSFEIRQPMDTDDYFEIV